MAQNSDLVAQIAALENLPRCELAGFWASQFGVPPPKGVRRVLLERAAAWHLQKKRHGGLSRHGKRLLALAMRASGSHPASIAVPKSGQPIATSRPACKPGSEPASENESASNDGDHWGFSRTHAYDGGNDEAEAGAGPARSSSGEPSNGRASAPPRTNSDATDTRRGPRPSEPIQGPKRFPDRQHLTPEMGRGIAPASRSRQLAPGTRLVREWNGRDHVVDVTEAGFQWDGRNYRSLSAIARAITGAHWSGPRFFGL